MFSGMTSTRVIGRMGLVAAATLSTSDHHYHANAGFPSIDLPTGTGQGGVQVVEALNLSLAKLQKIQKLKLKMDQDLDQNAENDNVEQNLNQNEENDAQNQIQNDENAEQHINNVNHLGNDYNYANVNVNDNINNDEQVALNVENDDPNINAPASFFAGFRIGKPLHFKGNLMFGLFSLLTGVSVCALCAWGWATEEGKTTEESKWLKVYIVLMACAGMGFVIGSFSFFCGMLVDGQVTHGPNN